MFPLILIFTIFSLLLSHQEIIYINIKLKIRTLNVEYHNLKIFAFRI